MSSGTAVEEPVSYFPLVFETEEMRAPVIYGNPLFSLVLDELEEIAKTKMPDVNANDIEAAKKIIAGTARSMGVEVEQ